MASTKSQKLEDQAATAALYVTKGKGDQSKNKASNYPLDADNKLSSAGAATSLKHANPKDLPSFPVVGLADTDSSAGAAASLANANQKTFEYWKPGDIPAANKAAMLAKDYKAAPLWHPELSAAGSKAALLAQRDGGKVEIWRPEGTDAGHSAADQAMRMKSSSPQLDYGHTEDGGRRALMAATGAMSSSRRRSGSTPIVPSMYPDSQNSAANALKAATSVSKGASRGVQPAPPKSPGSPLNAGRIHNQAITNLAREMYTSNPPVAPEVEEKNRKAALRSAAIVMAKQMYDLQQKHIEEAATLGRSDSHYAANSVHNRRTSTVSTDEIQAPPQYANLQEAAQKLAAERLAKLHDEHAAYRTYYGTQAAPQSHKLSIRGRPRRRASSDGQASIADEERSRQIRNEMSLFTDKLAQVDGKKRQQDRDSLLAAAQRNVRASMHGMDEKVFNETGKVSPEMMAEWEAKAKAKAKADSETRMVNHGRVNIGGGKYLDQSEIDAIAAARVQPTLDEITETAEKHRARDEELRQQQLERERLAAEKQADERERAAKTKEEWRLFREEEKREARAKKDEEKSRKVEEKRLREEEKRHARDEKALSKIPVEAPREEEAVVKEQPPVLEPIPKVASIAPKESRPQSFSGGEESIEPAVIPTSEVEPISAEEAALATVYTEESKLEPVYTAETGEAATGELGAADAIAQRVFSAPVEGEEASTTAAANVSTSDTRDLAASTSNTEVAPVVAAEITTAPVTEVTQAAATTTEHSTPDAPLAARIAPTAIPPVTTETTVTGPNPPTKDKDSGKVSSWLKTKFSRRASKPVKPDSSATAPTESKAKAFEGGAALTGPEPSNPTSEVGESSVREVAMAGKSTSAAVAPTVTPTVSPTTAADDDLYTASTRSPPAHQRTYSSSPSVSSLSSDEDTRGRSSVRLADTIQGQAAQAHQSTAAHHVPVLIAEPVDPALPRPSESSAGVGEEFEEARDTFDSEKLSPPEAVGAARTSDSPARDSKFLEDL